MAKRLVWSPSALECIDKIAEYIAIDSLFYAKAFVRNIFNLGNQILLFPEAGRIVPEVDDKVIREVIYGNYRVVYRIDKSIINILAVANSAQLLVIADLNN
ncbi:toxin Doc [Candidatus Termititenax spirochaetophilus]|uniref:Toxin Doc n=1 Tax=Candidatus Termititenax spirochaetophilus TaxID=2218522 RepID=A0A388T6F7_9BACT|nr:toxin Doc [Candidatus Termititenax spirochaetophilus]